MDSKPPLKSIDGRKCITQCYKKGQLFVHPVTLQMMLSMDRDVCAINPVPGRDPPYDAIYTDYCRFADNETYGPPKELESLLLSFSLGPVDFLENIYGIYSFDQTIKWTLENYYLPFDTIKRVHNCAWRVFGLIDGEISNLVMDYYFDIASNHWMKDYVKLLENNYSFTILTNNKKSTQNTASASVEIADVVRQDFLTHDFFVECIKSYIDEYRDKWDLIKSHYGSIKKYVFNKLVDVMENVSNK